MKVEIRPTDSFALEMFVALVKAHKGVDQAEFERELREVSRELVFDRRHRRARGWSLG